MYFRMFNRVTDAINILQKAQIDGEDTFISGEDIPPITLLDLQRHDEREPPD